ncbi:hypothetical protein K435DRAFT_808017 [Dendrothele bispora CBS 962.96]|uniref:Uncharacterized protein n=1 Tax=Dendrothele bispora (strain CBS 962.96) TaxID=1314807 RepID=A0A4V4HCC4_DENBC|nr:hypothetical protein K435DRAFT_808017 [Dendrothele bispora CBS 962.96]
MTDVKKSKYTNLLVVISSTIMGATNFESVDPTPYLFTISDSLGTELVDVLHVAGMNLGAELYVPTPFHDGDFGILDWNINFFTRIFPNFEFVDSTPYLFTIFDSLGVELVSQAPMDISALPIFKISIGKVEAVEEDGWKDSTSSVLQLDERYSMIDGSEKARLYMNFDSSKSLEVIVTRSVLTYLYRFIIKSRAPSAINSAKVN